MFLFRGQPRRLICKRLISLRSIATGVVSKPLTFTTSVLTEDDRLRFVLLIFMFFEDGSHDKTDCFSKMEITTKLISFR